MGTAYAAWQSGRAATAAAVSLRGQTRPLIVLRRAEAPDGGHVINQTQWTDRRFHFAVVNAGVGPAVIGTTMFTDKHIISVEDALKAMYEGTSQVQDGDRMSHVVGDAMA